jgi:hypothetical protein
MDGSAAADDIRRPAPGDVHRLRPALDAPLKK